MLGRYEGIMKDDMLHLYVMYRPHFCKLNAGKREVDDITYVRTVTECDAT